MTKHSQSIAKPRELSVRERDLLRWILDHGKPSARGYLGAVGDLRVVSRCGCGCASIDFIDAPGAGLEILSDHKWEDSEGHLFGAFAFAKGGKLAGLEVWSIDGEATPSELPDTAVLVPLD